MKPMLIRQCLTYRKNSQRLPSLRLGRARIGRNKKRIREGKTVRNHRKDDSVSGKAVQFEHLVDIAKHEQGVRRQPLVYNDPALVAWLQKQRA
jgi:hypothetical protein